MATRYRIIYQENDDLAFERIINTPKRAIGDATLKEIHKIAKEKDINLEQASLVYCEQENSKGKTILSLKKIINDILEKNFGNIDKIYKK